MVRKLTAAAVATLVVSCAPQSQKPVKVRALVLSSNGEYVPTEVSLQTVTDIVALQGDVVKMVGGARILLDSNDPESQAATTEEAFTRSLVKEAGRDVTASYITDDQGVLWPADFHTWNLVTTYYNFERAWDYFTNTVAVSKSELPQMTVYYFPDFTLKDVSDKPQRDNALFFAPVQAFMVLPFDTLQKAPLAINASVLTHEYSHLVFNRRVYDGHPIPAAINAWTSSGGSTPALNAIKALDEGLADFHAYVASCKSAYGCNTRVLATSFEGSIEQDRDLANTSKNCMSDTLLDQLYNGNFNDFSGREYQVGTLLASSLYFAAQSEGDRQELARAVVAAYSDTTPSKPGFNQLAQAALSDQSKFTFDVGVRSIVRHITNANLKLRVCSQFATRLLPLDMLTGTDAADCPASTTAVTGVCP